MGKLIEIEEKYYLILSTERRFMDHYCFWWKRSKYGYTADVLEAGQFTYEEACEIVENAKGMEFAFTLDQLLGKGKNTEIYGWGFMDVVPYDNIDLSEAEIKCKDPIFSP